MAITKLMHMKESKTGNRALHLKNSIAYILNDKKTQNGKLVGGLGIHGAKDACRQFLDTKKYHGKEWGRQGYHYVLSFKEGEVTSGLALQITREFTEQFLRDDYDCVYAVHDDTLHRHGHVIFNSVSNEGMKYHYGNGDWKTKIQPITNSLCRKYGLSHIGFDNERGGNQTYDAWEAQKEESGNWKQIICRDIEEAVSQSDTYEEFLTRMRDTHHYRVREGTSETKGAYLSLLPYGKKQAVRSYGLAGCAVEEIKERIKLKGVRVHPDDSVLTPKELPHIKKYAFCRWLKPYPKWKPQWKQLPRIQARALYYWMTLQRIQHARYRPVAWKYKKELLRIKKLEKECKYLVRHDIRSTTQLPEKKASCDAQIKVLQYAGKDIHGRYREHKKAFSLLKEYRLLEREQDNRPGSDSGEKRQRMEAIAKEIRLQETAALHAGYKEELLTITNQRKAVKEEQKILERILENQNRYEEGALELSRTAKKETIRQRAGQKQENQDEGTMGKGGGYGGNQQKNKRVDR